MKQNWHAARNSNDSQGLVIDENTGANIAVTYEAKDAPLIAAAPDLLSACESAQSLIFSVIQDLRQAGYKYIPDRLQSELRKMDAAIQKAKGE